ncbi:hypothetical protein PG993_010120 [Apiospora rasikravindrae]|uniref:Uncharacterized protein n=1 Tax=Apiospora rasikravindrae TaxID=990691 RepID=A0ABR1SLA4_9PEZI
MSYNTIKTATYNFQDIVGPGRARVVGSSGWLPSPFLGGSPSARQALAGACNPAEVLIRC